MKKVLFERKAFKEQILPRDEFIIKKVVELDNKEFNKFLDDMLDDYDFIKENKDLMFIDKEGVYHSILVTSKEADYGILVQSGGYSYARYSAYISKSDLGGFTNG